MPGTTRRSAGVDFSGVDGQMAPNGLIRTAWAWGLGLGFSCILWGELGINSIQQLNVIGEVTTCKVPTCFTTIDAFVRGDSGLGGVASADERCTVGVLDFFAVWLTSLKVRLN